MRSELRQPRVRVTLAGSELGGVLSAEVDSKNHFAADRFRVGFASRRVQQELLHIPGAEVVIDFGLGGDWTSVLTGSIDCVRYEPVGGTVEIEGRDLSSRLIEAQIDETFANQTASEIAYLLGLRHGLLVLADPTFTPVGRFYQSEHDRVALSQFARTMTEWDLLSYLAVREGFDLYMLGRTLRFGFPVPLGSRSIQPTDCIGLQLFHQVGLARPINVQVRSWNSRTGEVATGVASGIGIGPQWIRKISRPNLTNASAQEQAERVVGDLKRHEWTATLTMPGELDLSARSFVVLEGSRSLWDRLYRVTQISRRFDVRRGFTQTVGLQGVV